MAKRFTDTEKWRDEWYGALSNEHRIIWQYLLDNCSNAGIFKKDWRLLRFQCNTTITEQDFLQVFKGRVIDCGNYFFIPKFLKFQNKKGLNSNKPAIVAIREELIQNNLIQIVRQSLGNDFLIIKGTGKGKDNGNGQGNEKGEQEKQLAKIEELFPQIFDELYLDRDVRPAFREIDLPDQLSKFKAKVRGSPFDYQIEDTGRMRNAFLYQLRQTKPNKIKQPKEEIPLEKLKAKYKGNGHV